MVEIHQSIKSSAAFKPLEASLTPSKHIDPEKRMKAVLINMVISQAEKQIKRDSEQMKKANEKMKKSIEGQG